MRVVRRKFRETKSGWNGWLGSTWPSNVPRMSTGWRAGFITLGRYGKTVDKRQGRDGKRKRCRKAAVVREVKDTQTKAVNLVVGILHNIALCKTL